MSIHPTILFAKRKFNKKYKSNFIFNLRFFVFFMNTHMQPNPPVFRRYLDTPSYAEHD